METVSTPLQPNRCPWPKICPHDVGKVLTQPLAVFYSTLSDFLLALFPFSFLSFSFQSFFFVVFAVAQHPSPYSCHAFSLSHKMWSGIDLQDLRPKSWLVSEILE